MIEIVSFLQLPGVCGGGQAAFEVPATEDGEVLDGRGFFFFLEKCFFSWKILFLKYFLQDSVVLSRLRALARGCGLDAKGCADMTREFRALRRGKY